MTGLAVLELFLELRIADFLEGHVERAQVIRLSLVRRAHVQPLYVRMIWMHERVPPTRGADELRHRHGIKPVREMFAGGKDADDAVALEIGRTMRAGRHRFLRYFLRPPSCCRSKSRMRMKPAVPMQASARPSCRKVLITANVSSV